MLSTVINTTETTYSCQFNMYLVINKCVTAVQVSNFSGHYLRNRSTLYIGVLGYIGIVQHKEHSPEVLSIPPGTPCIPFPSNLVHQLVFPPSLTLSCHLFLGLPLSLVVSRFIYNTF